MFFFFQAEDGIRDRSPSRGLGDVYKRQYIRGLQCYKSLYLNKFRPYLRDKISEEQLAKFARGHAVGKVAQQLFPGGIVMSRPGISSAVRRLNLSVKDFR